MPTAVSLSQALWFGLTIQWIHCKDVFSFHYPNLQTVFHVVFPLGLLFPSQ